MPTFSSSSEPGAQPDHLRAAGPARRKPDGDEIAAVVSVIVDETRRRCHLVPCSVDVARPRARPDGGAQMASIPSMASRADASAPAGA